MSHKDNAYNNVNFTIRNGQTGTFCVGSTQSGSVSAHIVVGTNSIYLNKYTIDGVDNISNAVTCVYYR